MAPPGGHGAAMVATTPSLFAPETEVGDAPAAARPDDGRVGVLLPLPFDQAFDYASDRPLAPGTLVRVTFGRQPRVGVVWAGRRGTPPPAAKLKPVDAVLDLPPLSDELCRLVERTADYTLSPAGAVLRMVLSCPAGLSPPPTRAHVVRAGPAPDRLTDARRRVLDRLADGLPRVPADLAREAGVSDGVVRGLVDAGTLALEDLDRDPPLARPDPATPGPALNPEQHDAFQAIARRQTAGGFEAFLLEGVTGSGKTEVYFEAIARALADDADAQVAVLLPEIALTLQWLDRFARRFGCAPVQWHSGLTAAARRQAWRGVAEGRARVVVGARSALFLPYRRLKLIVVDEEHDPSFKQEDGVLYHARDMAVMRASLAQTPVILASATPSLESRVNARQGRYTHLRLTERHGAAVLPAVETVDMRTDGPKPGRWLAPALVAAIDGALDRGEQSLLFLNRRGYAPLTLCRQCGARYECPNCTAWLVEHRYRGRLECHHCGHSMPTPDRCFECGAEGELVACGPGVERLGDEVAERWPGARAVVLASDTLTGPDDAARVVARIEASQVDIVVGTQLITKGYHFPALTVVGVVDADLGLKGGDLRAAERTYQQLVQVAGRAGRADREGAVYLQTYDPAHPVTRALITGDKDRFMDLEEEARARAGMPPFGRLAGLVVEGPDLAGVVEAGRLLARTAPRVEGAAIYGPVPAPLARLRGRHRHRLLVQTGRDLSIQRLLRAWIEPLKLPPKVRLKVDIDPISFL